MDNFFINIKELKSHEIDELTNLEFEELSIAKSHYVNKLKEYTDFEEISDLSKNEIKEYINLQQHYCVLISYITFLQKNKLIHIDENAQLQ